VFYLVKLCIDSIRLMKYFGHVSWVSRNGSTQCWRLLPGLTDPQRESLSSNEKHFHKSASSYSFLTASLFCLNKILLGLIL
jgi:hypothetical protein